jgi:hypothetical protein
MTPEQETRGAELFAEGKSERQVAAELGAGTGSSPAAHAPGTEGACG